MTNVHTLKLQYLHRCLETMAKLQNTDCSKQAMKLSICEKPNKPKLDMPTKQ